MNAAAAVRVGAGALCIVELLAGCASVSRFNEERVREPNVVTTSEPAGPSLAEPALPSQPPMADSADDLVLGVSHMVANDGWWARPALGAPAEYFVAYTGASLRCRPLAFAPLGDPLSRIGDYGVAGAGFSDGAWFSIALAVDDRDYGSVRTANCGAPWFRDASATRLARLAPEVSGRDTSLLFTTARARMPAAGRTPDVIGGLLPGIVEAPAGSGTTPRTAKPRPTSAEGAPSIAAAAPAAAPSAEPSSPASSAGGRPAHSRPLY